MLMLNLFAFICAEGDFLSHHGVILCPAHPGSEHTLDPFYLLLEACLSLSAPLYPSIPALFLFIKVVIIFQPVFIGMLGSAGV